jgi:catechol 2,3-dioxygenase-like lactoylglutathione lyase family enzyme
MDNVLIVVDDLEAAKAFFIELGLKLEGETTVEGPAIGALIGLKDVRATLAMLRTPDGQGIELETRRPLLPPRRNSYGCRNWRM